MNPTPSIHRLRRGLPGSLILFAPHAFAPQRQFRSRRPPSPLIFLPISTDFTPTPGILPSSPELKTHSSSALPGLSPGLSHQTIGSAYAPFTPSNSEQRLHPPYYRGCWHGVSRCFLWRYRQRPRRTWFFPPDRALRPEGLHHPRGVAASDFRPLRNIPHCCLP